jgi:Bacterial Ig-like domain (group 2)
MPASLPARVGAARPTSRSMLSSAAFAAIRPRISLLSLALLFVLTAQAFATTDPTSSSSDRITNQRVTNQRPASPRAIVPASAQIRYVPHYIMGAGFVTKLTINNLTGATNNVVVNIISQSGVLQSSTNYVLSAHATQRIETLESARFGPYTVQWAIVGSDSDVGVNTFFELTNGNGLPNIINTIGFNDAPAATSQQLPVEFELVPGTASFGRTVGLAMANTSGSPCTAVLTLLNSSGASVASTTVNLGAFAQTGIDLSTVTAFVAALPPGNFVGQLSISSTTPVAAIALGDDLGPFFGTPPLLSGHAGQHIIPHIVNGGGYITKLTFMNLSSVANALDVKFFDPQGNLLQDTTVNLSPLGSARIAAPESSRFQTSATTWAIVTAPQPAAVNLYFEIEDGNGTVINTVGFNDAIASTKFDVPVEFQPTPQGASIGRTVGLALANPGASTANVSLRLRDSSGLTLAAHPVVMAPNKQTAMDLRNVAEFIPVLPASDFVGVLTVTSDTAVYSIALGDDYGPFYATPIMLASTTAPTPPTLQTIAVLPATPTVLLGSTQQLTAMGTYNDGTIQDLTATAAWNSSNAGAATISATGLVTTVAAGQSTMKATAGAINGSTVLTVSANGVASVSVAPANPSIAINGTQQFIATVQGVGTFSSVVNWFVNDVAGGNATVGTVSASGLYTAPSTVPNPTIVTIKATSATDSTKSGFTSITIVGQTITGNVFSGGALTNATVNLFTVNAANGSKGAQFGTGTTDSSGNFTLSLTTVPAGPVALTASGGTYLSAADGTQMAGTISLSAILDALTGPKTSVIAVTPLTDFVTTLTTLKLKPPGSVAALGTAVANITTPSFADAHAQSNSLIAALYGLGPTTTVETLIPKFSKGDITANPKNFAAGFVFASLAKQGKRLVSATPDALVAALSSDLNDGVLDGKASAPIPLGSGVLASTAGTTDFLVSVNSCVSSCDALTSGGVTPQDLPAVNSGVATGVASSVLTPRAFGLTAGSSAALATLSFGGHQYVFIAGRSKGIIVLDVTDPAHIPTPKAWTFLANVTFQQNFVGGVVPMVGTASHAQVLVYALAVSHIALINAEVLATGTPGVDDNRLVDFETNLTFTHNPPNFSDISPLIAGGIADNGRKGVWLTTADGYAFFDLNTNSLGKTYPPDSGQQLAENLGGDITHNLLLAGNYVGMQFIDLAKQKSYDMDSNFFNANIASLASSQFVDANAVDTGFQVGIGTADHTSTSFFINLANLVTNDTNSTFVPAAGGFVSIHMGAANLLDLTGPAADSTSHLVMFSGDDSPDVAVGVLQDPASVPAGTWKGMSDWVFYNITNSLSLNAYFGNSDPHAFGTVFNVGVNKPFGYLLDARDTFVIQVDMQGLLGMTRQGSSGDAAHQPAGDPAAAGILSAIAVP